MDLQLDAYYFQFKLLEIHNTTIGSTLYKSDPRSLLRCDLNIWIFFGVVSMVNRESYPTSLWFLIGYLWGPVLYSHQRLCLLVSAFSCSIFLVEFPAWSWLRPRSAYTLPIEISSSIPDYCTINMWFLHPDTGSSNEEYVAEVYSRRYFTSTKERPGSFSCRTMDHHLSAPRVILILEEYYLVPLRRSRLFSISNPTLGTSRW